MEVIRVALCPLRVGVVSVTDCVCVGGSLLGSVVECAEQPPAPGWSQSGDAWRTQASGTWELEGRRLSGEQQAVPSSVLPAPAGGWGASEGSGGETATPGLQDRPLPGEKEKHRVSPSSGGRRGLLCEM